MPLPPASTDLRTPDGSMWWDGQSWQPVGGAMDTQGGSAPITVGREAVIGAISVDPGGVRGERIGGITDPHGPATDIAVVHGQPHVVMPVEVVMFARPAESTLVLVALECGLAWADGEEAIWRCNPLHLMAGMPCRTLPSGDASVVLDVRFALNSDDFNSLEKERQQIMLSTSATAHLAPVFPLQITFTGQVAAVSTMQHAELGTHSALSFFWETEIPSILVEIEHDHWSNDVIPAYKARLRRNKR